MLANAAVEYTYELKYLRPFHFDKSFIKSQVNMQPNLTKAHDRMVL
jgi:hypothetical protein